MKLPKQRQRYIALFAGLIISIWLFNNGARLDFSQDYRSIQGVKNIILERNGQRYLYKRCFCGLKKIGDTWANHPDTCKQCSESDASSGELYNSINIDNWIRQSIYSPDKKYILYCEIKYVGTGGTSDEEYCYYRAYEIETGKIITLYQAYREWYNLSWHN